MSSPRGHGGERRVCSGTLLGVPCSPGRHEREPRGFRSAAGGHPSRGVGLLPGCGAPRHLCASRVGVASLPDGREPLSGSRGSFGDSHPRGWLCVWGIRGTRGASKPPRRLLRRLPLTCYLCEAFAPAAEDLIHVNRGVTTWRSAYFLRVCVMENMRPVSSEAEVLTRQVYSSGNVYCTFLMFAFLKQK